MCGIFGLVATPNSKAHKQDIVALTRKLFLLSESRGIESAGIAVDNGAEIRCFKQNVSAKTLLRGSEFTDAFAHYGENSLTALIAHARLVTNGTSEDNRNNQPVVKDEQTLVHNGIIVNEASLWEKYADHISKQYQVDSEVLASLINHFLQSGLSFNEIFSRLANEIKGAASIAGLLQNQLGMYLWSNTGSMYYLSSVDNSTFLFASEEHILRTSVKAAERRFQFDENAIQQLKPGTAILVDLESGTTLPISDDEAYLPFQARSARRELLDLSTYTPPIKPPSINTESLSTLVQDNTDAINALTRCSRCILPETFPFIRFDNAGVCNYCLNHTPHKPKSREELETIVEQHRKQGKADCIVAMSGGRDSSYGLHKVKNELGLNPITFTYDWGMVTDIARRNIARMCGELGIENILVSANIPQKREFIRKNVSAWLKKPDLGIIPLFMAGDKYFFEHVNTIKQQTGIKLNIWSANQFENTDFKTGFCGIPPEFDKQNIDELGMFGRFKMPAYYLASFIKNPAYINSSLSDTLGAYKAYYFAERSGICMLFDYLKWDEEEIDRCLIDEYGWETSPTTKSTWRIGDGTAAFYNYIYYTMAGFSEFDTFRSNQIREGVLSRDVALSRSVNENRANLEGIKWYCDIAGLDISSAMTVINSAPKLYEQ